MSMNADWENSLAHHFLFGVSGPIDTLRWLSLSEEEKKYGDLKNWVMGEFPKAASWNPLQSREQFRKALHSSIKKRAVSLIDSRKRDLDMWEKLKRVNISPCEENFVSCLLEAPMRKTLSLASIPPDQILKREISLLQKWENDPALVLSRQPIETVTKVEEFLVSFRNRQSSI